MLLYSLILEMISPNIFNRQIYVDKMEKMKMKILFYAWNIYDEDLPELEVSPNGGSIAIRNIVEYVGRKCEVYLFLGKKKMPAKQLHHINIVNTEKYPDDEDSTLEKNECWLRTMLSAFENTIIELHPDFVNLHGSGELLKRCIIKCRELNVKYAYTNHLYIGLEKIIEGYEKSVELEKDIFSIPNLMVTTVSTTSKVNILRDYPNLNEENIDVILNGTDFKYKLEDSSLIEQYNLQGKKILLCIGTIIKRKNQIQILHAFSKIKKEEREDIAILFCGKDKLDGVLQREIEKYELQNNLIYVGCIPNKEMQKYYSIADGYILISLAEGLSLTMLEAMVFGLPLIMFDDVEGASDLADDKVTVFVHEKEDENVIQAILEWNRREWDKAYIQEYAKYFNLERVADDYIAYYKKRLNILD